MHNGKNDWQYWTTYIQDKNNTVWRATLNVAESANGVKYLYDIDPIKKVGQSVKSDTSTTGDIIAQNQTESQAQIRSSTLSDRDVLRIAAQMAKNSESMLDIKKEKVISSASFSALGHSEVFEPKPSQAQYTQNQTESQAQIRSSTLSDRDVLRIAAQMAKNSESMLDIKKSLSIADQFPGFNIISVLFLTEFLCIFFDKYNSIFDDISRIHSDSTPLEHFFSMPCREAATLPDCTCVRTMNFNPCAP